MLLVCWHFLIFGRCIYFLNFFIAKNVASQLLRGNFVMSDFLMREKFTDLMVV